MAALARCERHHSGEGRGFLSQRVEGERCPEVAARPASVAGRRTRPARTWSGQCRGVPPPAAAPGASSRTRCTRPGSPCTRALRSPRRRHPRRTHHRTDLRAAPRSTSARPRPRGRASGPGAGEAEARAPVIRGQKGQGNRGEGPENARNVTRLDGTPSGCEQRGFTFEGRRRACVEVGGAKIDVLLMALLLDAQHGP